MSFFVWMMPRDVCGESVSKDQVTVISDPMPAVESGFQIWALVNSGSGKTACALREGRDGAAASVLKGVLSGTGTGVGVAVWVFAVAMFGRESGGSTGGGTLGFTEAEAIFVRFKFGLNVLFGMFCFVLLCEGVAGLVLMPETRIPQPDLFCRAVVLQ